MIEDIQEAVISALISAAITGIFTLIAKRIEKNPAAAAFKQAAVRKLTGSVEPVGAVEQAPAVEHPPAGMPAGTTGAALPAQAAAGTPAGTPAGTINYSSVLRQVGVVQALANIVGVALGFALVASGSSMQSVWLTTLVVGSLLLTGGFFWSALTVERALRFRHLSLMAAGVAVSTLMINIIMNAVFFQEPVMLLGQAAAAAVQSAVCAAAGGLLAGTIKRC